MGSHVKSFNATDSDDDEGAGSSDAAALVQPDGDLQTATISSRPIAYEAPVLITNIFSPYYPSARAGPHAGANVTDSFPQTELLLDSHTSDVSSVTCAPFPGHVALTTHPPQAEPSHPADTPIFLLLERQTTQQMMLDHYASRLDFFEAQQQANWDACSARLSKELPALQKEADTMGRSIATLRCSEVPALIQDHAVSTTLSMVELRDEAASSRDSLSQAFHELEGDVDRGLKEVANLTEQVRLGGIATAQLETRLRLAESRLLDVVARYSPTGSMDGEGGRPPGAVPGSSPWSSAIDRSRLAFSNVGQSRHLAGPSPVLPSQEAGVRSPGSSPGGDDLLRARMRAAEEEEEGYRRDRSRASRSLASTTEPEAAARSLKKDMDSKRVALSKVITHSATHWSALCYHANNYVEWDANLRLYFRGLDVESALLPPDPLSHVAQCVQDINREIASFVLKKALQSEGLRFVVAGKLPHAVLQDIRESHDLNVNSAGVPAFDRLRGIKMGPGLGGLHRMFNQIADCRQVCSTMPNCPTVTNEVLHHVFLSALDPLHVAYYRGMTRPPGSVFEDWQSLLEAHSIEMGWSSPLLPPMRGAIAEADAAGVGLVGNAARRSGPSMGEERCDRCNKRGHDDETCSVDMSTISCYACGKLGHLARNCESREGGGWIQAQGYHDFDTARPSSSFISNGCGYRHPEGARTRSGRWRGRSR